MRVWLYQLLTHTPALQAIVGQRITQGEARSTSVGIKPYLFYTIGVRSNLKFSEKEALDRQFFQIYVHDSIGDYTRIDDICRILVDTLDQQSAPAEGIIRVEHLETSTDLDDQTLGTILRYIRFAAIIKRSST